MIKKLSEISELSLDLIIAFFSQSMTKFFFNKKKNSKKNMYLGQRKIHFHLFSLSRFSGGN